VTRRSECLPPANTNGVNMAQNRRKKRYVRHDVCQYTSPDCRPASTLGERMSRRPTYYGAARLFQITDRRQPNPQPFMPCRFLSFRRLLFFLLPSIPGICIVCRHRRRPPEQRRMRPHTHAGALPIVHQPAPSPANRPNEQDVQPTNIQALICSENDARLFTNRQPPSHHDVNATSSIPA
jgi:hypothetical protein